MAGDYFPGPSGESVRYMGLSKANNPFKRIFNKVGKSKAPTRKALSLGKVLRTVTRTQQPAPAANIALSWSPCLPALDPPQMSGATPTWQRLHHMICSHVVGFLCSSSATAMAFSAESATCSRAFGLSLPLSFNFAQRGSKTVDCVNWQARRSWSQPAWRSGPASAAPQTHHGRVAGTCHEAKLRQQAPRQHSKAALWILFLFT